MNKTLFWPLLGLMLLLLLSLGADWLSWHDYDHQYRDYVYHAPMIGQTVEEGTPYFVLGTDSLGRDIWARILRGSRISLLVGFCAVLLTSVLGLLVGGIAGYCGGWVDRCLMRLCELLMSFPLFYLMLALRAMVPAQFSATQTYYFIIGILSFLAWPSLARVIRGMVLSLRERDFVVWAEKSGEPRWRMIISYVLPQTFSYTIVSVTLTIPSYILGEAGLSFLGLGIEEPEPSWGNMLRSAMDIVVLQDHPWVLASGFCIVFTVVVFNSLGQRLQNCVGQVR